MQERITLTIEVAGADDRALLREGLVKLFSEQLNRLTETASVVGYSFPDDGTSVPVIDPVSPQMPEADASPTPGGADAATHHVGAFRSSAG